MAGTMPWYMRTTGPTPAGYQEPDKSAPGFPVQSADQMYTQGAPAGYTWDPVKHSYVPTVGSATNKLDLQSKLLSGISGATAGSSAGTTSVGGSASGGAPSASLAGLTSAVSGSAPQLANVDTTDAENAAFARAKDRVGQTASGALAGLRSSLGGRGMLGGGAESRGTAGVINRGQGELGDVSRGLAIDAAGNAQKNAVANFEGGITERGQDIASGTATRGQDIQATEEANRTALLQTQLQWQKQQAVLSGLLSALGSSGAAY